MRVTHIRLGSQPKTIMRKPLTAIEVLQKRNDKNEVGYAYGGDGTDWPAVQECLARGWIVYAYDMSVGSRHDLEGRKFQQRDIYRLTPAGLSHAIQQEAPNAS